KLEEQQKEEEELRRKLEEQQKEEEEHLKKEEQQKEEEEEEFRRKLEEQQKEEEELRRKLEEQQKEEEELRRKLEEQQKEEEEHLKKEEQQKEEEEHLKKEEQQKEEEQKPKSDIIFRKIDEDDTIGIDTDVLKEKEYDFEDSSVFDELGFSGFESKEEIIEKTEGKEVAPEDLDAMILEAEEKIENNDFENITEIYDKIFSAYKDLEEVSFNEKELFKNKISKVFAKIKEFYQHSIHN
ncbi:MAG: hypothetical protein KKF44_07815, partial [Nanoarchaeota archaeon]|nr:hypothetical protein [Nanoarchaeota archaeon]